MKGHLPRLAALAAMALGLRALRRRRWRSLALQPIGISKGIGVTMRSSMRGARPPGV